LFQRYTIHEVGHKDLEATFPSNVVGHDSVIEKCPSEGINKGIETVYMSAGYVRWTFAETVAADGTSLGETRV
jgi:hypothetical protein